MKRKPLHNGTHLTLNQRKIIQTGIENGSTKAAIAKTIGKDATTVAKEIRSHRMLKSRNAHCRSVICEKRIQKICLQKSCVKKCEYFQEPICNRRDKSPGACNGCEKRSRCYLDKYDYKAEVANEDYKETLVESREGYNLTEEGKAKIGEIIAPLLNNGQSVHQILSSHPEIALCEKTLYTYIEDGVFKDFDVDHFTLKEQVNRKLPKKCKKRREPQIFQNHKYQDYLEFCQQNPETPTTEMDTLYNNPSGPYLQTFIFERTGFMIGFLHQNRECETMAGSLDQLQEDLGNELFNQLFSLILTDRGSEFEIHRLFEYDKNADFRLNIFFCDPLQSSQKPHVENNHNYVRDIIPNGHPMEMLSQKDINLMFSHINSTPRKVFNDRSPYELFVLFYGEATADLLHISKIERDDVVLKPKLIFAGRK